MKYRRLGDTELILSEIGIPLRPLATADYGYVTEQDTLNLLARAFDMGFTYFDTADSYTRGYGERTLARALSRRRHDIVISTKCGYDFYRPAIDPDQRELSRVWTPSYIQYACEQSLRRLDTDYIDLLQLHHPGPDEIDDDELFGCLDDLAQSGKIRYYGIALDAAAKSEEAGEGAIEHRAVSAVQLDFGILDQQPGRRLIERAQSSATGIVAYDPTATGALEYTDTSQEAHSSTERLARDVFERRRHERELFTGALRELGGSMTTWAIKFALASPIVASTLPIVASYEQLLELSRIADDDEMPREFAARAFALYDERDDM